MALAHPNITLGTAGHIDHGKTALIRFLTGCETDRLREEKERGLSIDLGFAPCTIGGRMVGIVDVPGHEAFVKTMVAGACGMDGVILVVAADDGVMPQTREHLEIVTLLGVRHGLVALTKVDRVDADHMALVTDELRGFLRGTFLEGAPIIPMCNLTGDGFEAFYRALDALVSSITPRRTDGVFRLPVDRAFSARGHGTIVTGIPISGTVSVGDEVELLPHGERSEVRAIEVYGEESGRAVAGQCAALNVRRWDHRTIGRGDAVAAAGYFAPAEWYAGRLELLPHPGLVLETGARVVLHTGTSEAGATLHLIESDRLTAGQSGLVQLHVQKPVVAGPGDRFILRLPTPLRTVGGGMIIEALERRLKRTRFEVRDDLKARADAVGDPARFVEYCVLAARAGLSRSSELSIRAKLPPGRLQQVLAALAASGRIVAVKPDVYAHRESLRRAGEAVVTGVRAHHEGAPQSVGVPADDIGALAGLPVELVDAAVSFLLAEGTLVEAAGRLALPGHSVDLSADDRVLLDRIETAFRDAGFYPPEADDMAAQAGTSPQKASWALQTLVDHGILVPVEKLFFHRDAVARARGILESYLRDEGRLESVKFKYLLDTTRKYAIPLLDYFDRVGVTRRVGNTRYPPHRG
ncbi:MAG: selenocysteine-specific translation elongation factor [Candidatus Brocadiaceae bacterium]|nr:selenocysteine-specific translation elongation factor [Candidatus Brocadiaceae bacterium]